MNQANRKSKFSKYEVVVRREVEYTQTLEVEARTVEEACDVAKAVVDDLDHMRDWREGSVMSETAKAKVLR